MPANFCLMPAQRDEFLKAIKDGRIEPDKLTGMSSAERRKLFTDVVGEPNAKDVNALFESKLLLKNQQQGMITWAKRVGGLKPEIRRDLISRIEKLDRVLDPAEQQQFLNDLASTRLGVGVTQKEAKEIADMSNKVTESRANMKTDKTFASETERMEYGRNVVTLRNHVQGLKQEAGKMRLGDVKSRPGEALGRGVTRSANLARSLKSSMDNSSIFRQGWKTMWTNPGKWSKNAAQTFVDIAKTVKGKHIMDEVDADVISRPTYDMMKRAKLAVADITEEAFPSDIPEKVPGLGRLYRASQDAYSAFLQRQRADIFDKYVEIAKKNGVDLSDDKQLQSIGKMVNSLTGRGHLGKLEPGADTFNSVFFSPRLFKSHLDTLTGHQLQKGVTPFVRKQSAINTLEIISGTAAVLATANAMWPDSVELDPRSSDFGKIKIGDTRFDVAGGMAGVVTLAVRLAPALTFGKVKPKTKSTTSGTLTELNTGEFGSRTTKDVFNDFLSNKLAPVYSAVNALLEGEDFDGNKPTPTSTAIDMYAPIGIQNYFETKDEPEAANILAVMIADGLGIGTNTYGMKDNWNQNPGKELKQFRDKVGQGKFQEANDKYNQEYRNWFKQVQTNDDYKKLSEDDKRQILTSKKAEVKKYILKQYGFKYEKADRRKLPDL